VNWRQHPHAVALLVRGGVVLSEHETENEARIAAIRETRQGEALELFLRWRKYPERYERGARARRKR
jgi:hypothetical protein